MSNCFYIYGLRRSGNHAIINWLCSMMDSPLFLNDIGFGRSIYGEKRIPPESNYVDFIASYEDVEPSAIREISDSNWVFKYHSPHYRNIIILRDFKNWVASMYTFTKKFEDRPDIRSNIKKWKRYESYAADSHLNDSLVIEYSRWVDSEEYRMSIAGALNLDYNDSTLLENTQMGSSFGTGYTPGFNDRWGIVKDDPELMRQINEAQKKLE